MEKIIDIIYDYNNGDFLCPKSGAKLASLFGLDRAESQRNESFQFTAPKWPKKSCAILGLPPQKPVPPPCAPAVLFATAVHAFSFVNGQYVKQGKMAAVLGNHVTKEYKILLYGSKQKQITKARIHRGFFHFSSFYSILPVTMSLMFDSEKSWPEFCKEVSVAQWNSEASSDSLVTQDLVLGEGQAVDVGDTVEVAYSGWLLHKHSLGQVFDSNLGKEKLQRVKLGAGKALRVLCCLSYRDGMLGMQKGGQRLLIVPPSMGYGSKGILKNVPTNSTLVFDVEIHRVKFSKDRHSRGSVDPFSTSPNTCSDTQSEENSSQLTSDASKAKLISRIAKMGQPMLPFLAGAIPAQPDPSDSETEVRKIGKVAYITYTVYDPLYQPDDAQKPEAVPPQADSNTTQGSQVHLSGALAYQLQQDVLNLQQRVTEIQAELRQTQSLCSDQPSGGTELVKQGEQSEQRWRAEKQKCKEMEAIIQNMDEEMQDLRAEKENLDQILSDRKRKWQVQRERFLLAQEEQHQRSQQEILHLFIKLKKARYSTEPLMKQVKRVMNGVFQSLRTEFDSQESYSGHTVLEILQNTIKNITMKLLSEPWELESDVDEDKAEEEYLSTEECLQMENMQKENNEIEGKGQH
ncbi:FK506-binding protein 15-like [Sinocyclocheilus grahami]|uniref:FK506-binding protein 15-like n=1 Tax=Sinocyclocheilus grahami TaxID=75366 RepID=UPI0007AD06A1|nr:PREDICTED: FK506-binding protein 15-like [Sinocyclocheilus grahami]